jgi:hypothetical protein
MMQRVTRHASRFHGLISPGPALSPTPVSLQHFLYTSRLAPGAGFEVVPSILEVSRARNRERGLTGILVFDGERFAQWLEGPPAQVLALAARIEADTRHVDLRVLYAGCRTAAARRSERWSAGYAEAADLDRLHGETAPRDAAALDLFISLAPAFDLSF